MAAKCCGTRPQIKRVKDTIKKVKKDFKSKASTEKMEKPKILVDFPPGMKIFIIPRVQTLIFT